MKLSLNWLLVAAPLFSLLGSYLGIANLGDQFKEVVPHIEAVVNFILLLLPLIGGLGLFKHVPSPEAQKRLGN